MTNSPDPCRNCHIIQEQFDGWMNSSHWNVAVCNYCYAPREIVPKRTTNSPWMTGRGFSDAL